MLPRQKRPPYLIIAYNKTTTTKIANNLNTENVSFATKRRKSKIESMIATKNKKTQVKNNTPFFGYDIKILLGTFRVILLFFI